MQTRGQDLETVDPQRPSASRVWDYWLGGSHHFASDRAASAEITRVVPDMPDVARANRAYLRRAVRTVAGAGVRQFLDLGSGIPTEGNVHEVARDLVSGARVVYVDIEPGAVTHSRAILGDDPAAARATAERIWDRTPGTEPAVQMANQMGMVFAKLNCKPRWRKRLPELAIPTLVVHGRRDPFFPVGNGEAIAREIPGARLLVLEEAATAIPDAAAGEVAAAMLAL